MTVSPYLYIPVKNSLQVHLCWFIRNLQFSDGLECIELQIDFQANVRYVARFAASRLESSVATLLTVTLLHGCF